MNAMESMINIYYLEAWGVPMEDPIKGGRP